MKILVRKHIGTCVVCGEEKELTFEHIPPKSSGNSLSVKTVTGEAMLNKLQNSQAEPWDLSGLRYQSNQRGYGEYSLCASCNNLTGSWYAQDYSDLVLGIGKLIQKERPPRNSLCMVTMKMRPLNFLKQLCAMAMTLSKGGCSDDFRDFILHAENQTFPSEYSIYLYIYVPGLFKYLGESVMA